METPLHSITLHVAQCAKLNVKNHNQWIAATEKTNNHLVELHIQGKSVDTIQNLCGNLLLSCI